MREYMRKYRANKRLQCKATLGGKCVKCGSTSNLEFDHVDRTTKVDGIANLLTNSKETLELELKKCQLLCAPCHWKKSIESSDLVEAQHGVARGQLYKKGCRCNLCVEAAKIARRAYYEANGK